MHDTRDPSILTRDATRADAWTHPKPAGHERLTFIDDARGIGISLVVFGHTLRGLFSADLLPQSGVWGALDTFIYAFHMPLFFFLAGLFLVPERAETYRAFATKRIVRLGYPYLVWATLQTLLQVVLARYTNHALGFSALLHLGVEPPMQFWFLYALLVQALLLGLALHCGVDRRGLLLLAVLLFVTAPYVPLGSFMPLNQAREYLVYTALGVFFGAPRRLRAALQHASASLLAVALLGFGAVALALTQGLLETRLLGLVAALAGVSASLCLAVVIARHMRLLSRSLATWGQASLAIFVAHTMASAATRIALSKALHIDDVWVHLVAGTLVGIAAPLALYSWSKRRDFPYLFEWPLTQRKAALPEPAQNALTQG